MGTMVLKMTEQKRVKALLLFDRLESVENPPTKDEFQKMFECKGEMIPLLLEEIDQFASCPDDIEAKGKTYIRHIMAIFVLAYFREQSAYLSIIKLISQPSRQILGLTGEVVIEALGRVIASVYDGDIAHVKSVIENEKLDVWIRAGALDSFMVLWKEDVLSRQDVLDYLKTLMNGGLESKPSYVWDTVALIAYDLQPKELVDELREAIQKKLIEPVVLNEATLEDSLGQSFHEVLKQKENVVDGYIKSPYEELSWWLYPDRKLLQKGKDYEALDVPIVDKDVIPGERVAPMGWRSSTVVRGSKKIGRNELCLCGSGKKYKRCCLKA